MTAEAREILGLLSCLERQKNGRGVTLLQLSELWRGSKTKAHTKFLHLDSLTGYAAGSRYSKHEVDSISHKLVFDKVLEEISSASALGYSADYVRPGPKSQALLANGFRFCVRFAARRAPGRPKGKKPPSDDGGGASGGGGGGGSSSAEKKPKARRKSKGKTRKDEGAAWSPADLRDSPEAGPSSPNEPTGAKRKNEKTVLPKKHTDALLARIKKLVHMWAEEVSDAGVPLGAKLFHLFYCPSGNTSI